MSLQLHIPQPWLGPGSSRSNETVIEQWNLARSPLQYGDVKYEDTYFVVRDVEHVKERGRPSRGDVYRGVTVHVLNVDSKPSPNINTSDPPPGSEPLDTPENEPNRPLASPPSPPTIQVILILAYGSRALHSLTHEARTYHTSLSRLQGIHVPICYGFYVGETQEGRTGCLVLQDVGKKAGLGWEFEYLGRGVK